MPVVKLQELAADQVPAVFRLESFFSPQSMQSFAHATMWKNCTNVFAVLDAIHPYLIHFFNEFTVSIENVTIIKPSIRNEEQTSDEYRLPTCLDVEESVEIIVCPGVNPQTFSPNKIINTNATNAKKQVIIESGAVVLGGTFDVSDGSIHIGKNVRIEPNVYLKGPCIIGDDSTLRSGAYIRGDVIVGKHVVLRGEVKNALILDQAELCHPGYCGDSICGYKSHFGNQVTTANLNLFSYMALPPLTMVVNGVRYDTGRTKTGVILGDFSQLGCSSVTDPSTLVLRNTVVYPLSRLTKGIYGPDQIIKNKPLEKGVMEIAPLKTNAF